MRLYQRAIILRGEHDGLLAQLTAIRLPRSWYAVVWHSKEIYKSFDQPITPPNSTVFACFEDDDFFLGHIRLVGDAQCGVEFDFVEETCK
jgi:hypothetical protein